MNSNPPIEFIEQFKTIIIASNSGSGEPNASYAPFVFRDGSFYIFVSQLAAHTRNLLANSHCSVMLIKDESESANPFARHRLSFDCEASAIARDADAFEIVMEQFRSRFGPTVEMLQSLPDFILFELKPSGPGNFVQGFGNASSVEV